MDRLTALVLLRWRLDLRGFSRRRERLLGILLMIPFLAIFSVVGSALVFFGVHALVRTDADAALALVSVLATFVGLSWALSPLLTGVALSETHDMSRLLHFPIPLPTLAVSSFLANLLQPMVLAELPIIAALAAAATEAWGYLPLSLAGTLLSFAFVLAAAQVTGLLLHGLSRSRRLHDLALFLGLGLGFALSLGPILLLSAGEQVFRSILRGLLRSDLFVLSPFAWGVRAAMHGGRGDLPAFLGYAGLEVVAVLAALGLSAVLIHRIHRGELDLGTASARAGGRARMPFAGALGALVEKDLRSAWRDPALKATLFMGLVGPLLFILFITGGGGRSGTGIFLLAMFVGVSSLGSNAFGIERRGLALLMGFPVERWKVLVGKNVGALVFRLPGVLALVVAGFLLAPPPFLPAALTIALVTIMASAGIDNYSSILFPTAAPAPGRNPYGGSSPGRGLGGALLSASFVVVAVVAASPFVFLAWLPLLLEQPWLWLGSLPLAAAGAAAVYAMLVAGAAKLLATRETELLERVLEEA